MGRNKNISKYYQQQKLEQKKAEKKKRNRLILTILAVTVLVAGLIGVLVWSLSDEDGDVLPILCKNYTASSDLTVYTFTIDPKATFSDGVPVTPEDVVASLQESRNHKYYGRRLRFVNAISVTEDRKVRIYLSQPNGNLPLLLDIPIVKAD